MIVALVCATAARVLPAQVVETPQSFDSDGRVFSLTAATAARIGLEPPEWRVFGDYVEARLYQSSAGGYVLVVTRRDESVERHELSLADVAAIRQKVSALPPQFAFRTAGRASSAFVRNQTLMGLGVYAPSLALAITNETTGRVSTYLVAAGATFFAATQLARQIQITPEMSSLSTHMGLRGGATGAALAYTLDASRDGQAAAVLFGALGGTTLGLAFGSSWDPQEVNASQMGADVFGLTALGFIHIGRGDRHDARFLTRGGAAVLSAAILTGYAAGHAYGGYSEHNITSGDARTLWVTGALGAAAGSITYAGSDAGHRREAIALTGGYLVGVAAGELLLARRFDLSNTDASLMGLGTAAGGLIGLGVARLTDREGETDSRTMTFATIGGAGGLFLTHFLLAPPQDAGRAASAGAARSSLQFNPVGVALTAARVPGSFPLLSVTFR